jgi:peptide/nickel transport system substrate-binding protein
MDHSVSGQAPDDMARRDRARRTMRGIGLTIATVAALAAAPVAAQSPSTAAPTPGGTLLFARNQEPQTLNPIGAADNGSIFTIMQMCDQLVEVTDAPDPQPGLAESWTRSDDGLTWTFTLRDAMFSDGSPVTADDVVFSLTRWADPEINISYGGLSSSVDAVTKVDDKTVQVTLERPDGAFLDNLAMFVASIVPQAVVEAVGDTAFGEAPVCSGPFMLQSWARGQQLELVRNPNYWRAPEPYLDGVTFRFVNDDNTRMLQLQQGEVDVAEEVPYSQVERVDALDGVSVSSEPVFKWDAIWLNTLMAPLDEPGVRQALNYATPKQAILDTVLFGKGDIANHVIARVKYWDANVPAYEYDLEKAKELMAASSVPNGFDLPLLVVAGDSTEQAMAQVIQAAWAEIGVNVTIEPVDIGTAFTRWLAQPNEEMAATFPGSSLSSDTLSDDNLVFVFMDADAGLNSFGTGWRNPEAVAALKEANGSFDEAVRAAGFAKAQAIAVAEAPAVPLFFTDSRTGVSDRVHGFNTVPMGWWQLREAWLDQ